MKENELSCKDLMIGDYFRTKFAQKVVKVKEIKQSCVYTENNGYEYNEIEPILLTPEILEKNGFKRDPLWHHCDKDLDNYSISVQLGYANRIEYIKIAEKGKDNVIPSERTKMYLTHIKYLHQLQHALRLCGIEKTIEL